SVEDIQLSSRCAAALTSRFYFVYAVSVKFEFSWGSNGYLLQLSSRSYYIMLSTFLACPDREWGSPVPLTADNPVPGTNQPCVESFGPCPFRRPSDSLVFLNHFLLELGDFDEPLVRSS